MVVLSACFWYLLLQMLRLEVSYFSSFSVDTPPHPTPPPSASGKGLKSMGGVALLFVCLDTMGMRKLFWHAVIVLVYIKSTFAQLYQRHSGLAYWWYMACVCMQIRYCSMCVHMFVNVRVWCVHVCAYALILVCVYECTSDPFCLVSWEHHNANITMHTYIIITALEKRKEKRRSMKWWVEEGEKISEVCVQ